MLRDIRSKGQWQGYKEYSKTRSQEKLSSFDSPVPQGELKNLISNPASFAQSQHISRRLDMSPLFLRDTRPPVMHKTQQAWISEATLHSMPQLCDTAPVPPPAWGNVHHISAGFQSHLFPPACTGVQMHPQKHGGLQHSSEKSDQETQTAPVLGSLSPGVPEHCKQPIFAAQLCTEPLIYSPSQGSSLSFSTGFNKRIKK